MNKVELNGYKVDFDAATNLMDAEICEELHASFNKRPDNPTDQDFLDAYVKTHAEKFDGEVFEVN